MRRAKCLQSYMRQRSPSIRTILDACAGWVHLRKGGWGTRTHAHMHLPPLTCRCVFDLHAATIQKIPGVIGRSEKAFKQLLPSPDGKVIAMLSESNALMLLSAQSKQLIATLQNATAHKWSNQCITFSPDGAFLFASALGSRVQVTSRPSESAPSVRTACARRLCAPPHGPSSHPHPCVLAGVGCPEALLRSRLGGQGRGAHHCDRGVFGWAVGGDRGGQRRGLRILRTRFDA